MKRSNPKPSTKVRGKRAKKSRNKLVEGLISKKEDFWGSKRVFKKKGWEEFYKTYQKLYPNDEPLGPKEKEYIETHLTKMDDVKKAWYFHTMKTWTKEDYDNYTKIQLWMLGAPTKDLKKAKTIDQVEKILIKKKMPQNEQEG